MDSSSSSLYNPSLLDSYANPSQSSLHTTTQPRQPSNLRYQASPSVPQINITPNDDTNNVQTKPLTYTQPSRSRSQSHSHPYSHSSKKDPVTYGSFTSHPPSSPPQPPRRAHSQSASPSNRPSRTSSHTNLNLSAFDSTPRLNSSRTSVQSYASSTNSVFSSVSDVSADDELNKINMAVTSRTGNERENQVKLPPSLSAQFEQQYEEEQRRYAMKQNKLRTLFSNAHGHKSVDNKTVYSHNLSYQRYFNYVSSQLNEKYYNYSSQQTLKLNWDEVAGFYLFGDVLSNIFPNDDLLMQYLVHSELENGELIFVDNSKQLMSDGLTDFNNHHIFAKLLKDLHDFNEILDLYAANQQNLQSPKLFQIFKSFATLKGFSIPLAQAMFGNWLLSYNKDETIDNNYDNDLILTYFRKSARLSLVLKQLVDHNYFNTTFMSGFTDGNKLLLKTFFNKNNIFALNISLHNLGESYQVHNEYDTAVNLWEINCHLTKDQESGNLAILGLSNGFGFGNKFKTINKWGKKSKTNKFNTKRRIAQLYRILIKAGTNQDVGTSWVWKEKYD